MLDHDYLPSQLISGGWTVAAAIAAAVSLAGCASGSVGDVGDEVNAGLPVPPEQAWAFSGDGAITSAEYIQGFDAFAACVSDQGIEIIGGEPDPETGLISYGVPAEADRATVDSCYQTFFQDIDATFQTTNPQVAAQREREAIRLLEDDVFPCLERNGLEVPAVADPALAGDPEFMETFVDLAASGRCEN